MNLTKDMYEYLLNFANDREVLNMLSVNKKFRDEQFFKRIMKRRYPLIIRFKNEKESWKDFFILTIYYLSKLKEIYSLPYIPTLDFDPKSVYEYIVKYKKDVKPYITDGYHIIAILDNDDYHMLPLQNGHSLCYIAEICTDELVLDFSILETNQNFAWLAFNISDGDDLDSQLFINYKDAIDFLYDQYIGVIEYNIEEMSAEYGLSREEIIDRSNLQQGYDNKEIFIKNISENPIKITLYYPLASIYHFQLMKVDLPS